MDRTKYERLKKRKYRLKLGMKPNHKLRRKMAQKRRAAMHTGYKFSEEQLAARKRKKKGKWSKAARERQAIRMKERWKIKRHQDQFKAPINGKVMTIGQRLDVIDDQTARIRDQIGALSV